MKPPTESKDSKPRISLFKSPQLLRPWTARAPHQHSLLANLVDIFAIFVLLDEKVDTSEAEVALDLLRNAFPDSDHSWLARRLQRALRMPPSSEALAKSLAAELEESQLISLGLQLYLLVNASSQRHRGRLAFLDLFSQLGHINLGQCIADELDGDLSFDSPLPFTRLEFSTSSFADIALDPSCKDYAFRAYQAEQLIILKNTGSSTLWISGTPLQAGNIIRLRHHQRILLPNWTITYNDLNFFLNFQRSQQARPIFIHETDSGLLAERSKTRQSTHRIDFGTQALITQLRQSEITIKDVDLTDEPTGLPLFHKLTLGSGATVSLESIRQQAIEAGGRFRLSRERQSSLVSNDPSILGKGDLLISPGLAGKVTLRINFDPETSVGELLVIESEHTLLINGHAVRQYAKLTDGTLIRLSASQALRCRFSEGLIDEERTVIRELFLDGVTHQFSKTSTALDNIDFKVQRGEMLCIMGPSGSGKSTLLKSLAGHLKPSRGHIRFNGISLYSHRKRLAPFIIHMPQEDALNPLLTVREHLLHACAIRRPHLSSRQHHRRVDSILAELALQPLADRKVGSPGDKAISGGERGRLNLGLDLGSTAEIFLFDEPISGLSSKDSEHVAESLRSLARDKIVIASLHRPGSSVLNLFDKVLLLDKEGKVAFFGSPKEMQLYFREASLELQIPSRTDLSANEDGGADFVFDVLETPLHGQPAANESSSFARRFPPTFWQERFESHRLIVSVSSGETPIQTQLGDMPRAEDNMPIPLPRPRRLPDIWRLFNTHLKRSLLAKFRNRGTIYCTILEAPLLAVLIALTLRASADGSYAFSSGLHIVTYLFLTVTVGMFLGLTNSATEILRDLPTLRRERNCHYGSCLYITAKCTTLTILALIQCAIYVAIGHYFLEIEAMWFTHWLWMSFTAITGTAIAMFISTIVKSERAALSAIPLLLVPQLLLAGALVPFNEMNRGLFVGGDDARETGAEPVPAMLVPLRYAFEGVVLAQATDNPFDKQHRRIKKKLEALKLKTVPNDENDDSAYLTDDEAERIKILATGLTRLFAAEALSQKEAAALTKKIADTSLYGSMEELKKVQIYPDTEEATPCQEFFQNSRTDLLVLRGEIQRTATDNQQDPNVIGGHPKRSIFLDEWKFWFGYKVSSSHICKLVLFSVSITCLIFSTLIVSRWSRKVS